MDTAALDAITDIETLRTLVREQSEVIAERDRTIRTRDLKIDKLTHELARLRRVSFDAKSEAMTAVQRDLFDESMAADIAALQAELDTLQSDRPAAQRPRRKPVRRTLPDDLPREETIHEPDACDCPQCGQELVQIGEHVSEKLDVKPLEFFVRRDIYPQYACRPCGHIVAEPVAPAIIDRGLAAPGLLAQIAIQKHADHLPLYRQEAIMARHGVTISRTTLAEWCGVIGLRLQPLVDALQARLLVASILHADETPMRQLAPGKGKTQQTYLFAYRNTGPAPIIVFDYRPSRAGKHVAAFLGPWRGTLMVDGYGGYHQIFAQGVTELACWAHARRKFHDAWKANGSPVAKQALERIQTLYHIEAKLRDLDDTERGRRRQELAIPVLDALKAWLDDLAPKVLGSTGLHKAVIYTLKRWDALARYVHNGAWPIDNNPIERAIRPIAIGRKNWLFAGSESAGKRAAAIMSLIATAKANGLNPHAWLTDTLTRLPTTKDKDIETLLPLA